MSTPQPTITDVAVGDRLPPMTKRASRSELFLYSAASFNPHRIHYDRDYAVYEGHDDILVHGPLQGAWLTQFVTDWAGPAGRLQTIEWQNRASAYPDRDYVFEGTIVSIDPDAATVAIEITESADDGRVIMPATAVAKLPR